MKKDLKHTNKKTMISKVLGNGIKRNQIELLDIKVALGVISKVVE